MKYLFEKRKRSIRKGFLIHALSGMLLVAMTATASAQQQGERRISGTVKSESSGFLGDVSVQLKGTDKGTVTDAGGRYQIAVQGDDAVLVFSSVGYEVQEVNVGDRTTIDINMVTLSSRLGEVVVIGYGTQRKVSLTSAVAQVKGEELQRRPVGSLQQALQGLMPGFTILDQGGSPGNANTTMRVRGITTLSNNNPLVIVDGIEQPLTDINPNDIESLSVLKDASSTAIYGSRAANGVVLITTRRAKAGKVSVTYNGFYALQRSILKPEHMEIGDYLRLQNANYIAAGSPAQYTDQQIQDYVNGDRLQYPLPYDWYNAMLKTAPQTNHTLSLSGGSDVARTRLSVRYQDQDGIIANTNAKLSEIRANADFRVSPKINVATDINFRNNNNLQPQNITEIFRLMMQNAIWTVPKYPDGAYGAGPQGNNPLLLAERGGTHRRRSDYIVGNVKGEWQIIKGLKFTSQFAASLATQHENEFTASYEIRDRINPSIVRKARGINSLNEVRNNIREYTFNNLLNYTTDLGNHSFNVLAGYSTIQNKSSFLSAFRQGFYNNDIQSIGQGTNDATKSNEGYDFAWGLRSYFGRLNYSFDDRYLFEANGRYDGSSRFTSANRYSFFPSVSAGWRLSREKFWEGLSDVINEFKVRGSWGKTGNQAVDLYTYFSALNLVTYTFNGQPVQGYVQQKMASENLSWETTTQMDLGMDVQLLNNKISFSMDYYKKRTDGILLVLPVPGTLGLQPTSQNAGIVDNTGWEFTGGVRTQIGNVRMNINANFSINENKVVDLAGTGPYITGSDVDPRYIIGEGYPINSFWGYQTAGLFQSQAEANSSPLFIRAAQPGDVNYVDLNKDGKIDPNDMAFIGSPFPKTTFGASMNFTYKAFTLNMLLQGASGMGVMLTRALVQSGTAEAFTHKIYTNDVWTPENPGARFPRSIKFETRNQVNSDRNVIDADYLRFKNIQLLYELPSSWTRNVFIQRASVYVSATNLVTFSNLNEWDLDPEAVSGWQNYYPQVSVLTFGVNAQF